MSLKKAFLLTAGFGTRFQPQTTFLPKPALPIFNIPQALYPSGLLKASGVTEFYYNSHHLPDELNKSLTPYFKRESNFEPEILDSAGGIANSKSDLISEDNFWVVNGDSFITYFDHSILDKAVETHLAKKSLATMICIPKKDPANFGFTRDSNNCLTERSRSQDALHFIGLYILNNDIFNYIDAKPMHILHDVLLKPDLKKRVQIFNAEDQLNWYETGNEESYIQAHLKETKILLNEHLNSTIYKTYKEWDIGDVDKLVKQFKETRVWGKEISGNVSREFLCVPPSCTGDFSLAVNSCFSSGLNFDSKKHSKNKLLVHPSQW